MAETENSQNFRANRKNFFLTYSQCGELTREQVLEHLTTKGAISKYLIACEPHQDGGRHIHAYVAYEKKRDFRDCRWADVNGIHPNDAGSVRNHNCVVRYCGKQEDYITNFYVPKVDNFNQARMQPTYTECIKFLAEKETKEFMKFGHAIKTNARDYYKKPVGTPKFRLDQFMHPPLDLSKSCFLYGKSGAGKTQFAKAHFKAPLVVQHMDSLSKFDPLVHDGIVFDEVKTSHRPVTDVIKLLDIEEDSEIHIRYKTAVIPSGTPRIICLNDPNGLFPITNIQEEYTAMKRRVNEYPVDRMLFDGPEPEQVPLSNSASAEFDDPDMYIRSHDE